MRVLVLCLLALCACKNVDIPWQRPACAALQLQGDPPEVASLLDVRASGNSVLALWRGLEDPDDPLLLSIFDGQRWNRPYRLLEHSTDLQRTAISNAGVLLSAIDYESAEWPDAGTAEDDGDGGSGTQSPIGLASYDTQLTLVNDACNEVPLTKVRAYAAYAASTLADNGLTAMAWNDLDGNVQAVVVRAAQEPRRTTLAKSSENTIPVAANITALSDDSMIATFVERGPKLGDPQRLLTRRFWLQWQEAIEHDASAQVSGNDLAAPVVTAGPGASAALLWIAATRGNIELRLQRTDDGMQWSDTVVVHTSEQGISSPQLLFAPDGSRLAALWLADDSWRTLLIDGDEPLGEATDLSCNGRDTPSAIFDPHGELLIACGNDEGPATLMTFDGTIIESTPLGDGEGAATQPKLTAVPGGQIMAVWERHDGPAYDFVSDMGVPTPSAIVSAEIADGEVGAAMPAAP
jgi:hypothetical protein